MITKTWPYGTKRRGKVVAIEGPLQCIEGEDREGYIQQINFSGDPSAKEGDWGTLTFTKGGPTGGFWKFAKDQ
jgi:hypothetical protein